MKIIYVVRQLEVSGGSVSEINREEFKGVDLAIAFHTAQASGPFSWWEITVEYEPDL